MAAVATKGMCHKRERHGRHAFTLVELLVVIGIIALLISILLPTLRRAREAAKQVQCLSNIRQLSAASIMWANDHKGWMPGAGGNGILVWNAQGQLVAGPNGGSNGYPLSDGDANWQKVEIAEWIAWQRAGPDKVVVGQSNTTPSFNITYAGLARYLGVKHLDHASNAEAHDVNATADSMFRCPSDRVEAHFANAADPSHGSYLYSYAMNRGYSNPVTTYGQFGKGQRFDGTFNGRINSIRSPGEKVLFICQDEKTVDDGAFTPNAAAFKNGTVCDLVASRHEANIKKASSKKNPNEGNQDARGNVGFADGHGEFFSRKDSLRSRYSGNPTPDPAGF